jgi:hypothetical protein
MQRNSPRLATVVNLTAWMMVATHSSLYSLTQHCLVIWNGAGLYLLLVPTPAARNVFCFHEHHDSGMKIDVGRTM